MSAGASGGAGEIRPNSRGGWGGSTTSAPISCQNFPWLPQWGDSAHRTGLLGHRAGHGSGGQMERTQVPSHLEKHQEFQDNPRGTLALRADANRLPAPPVSGEHRSCLPPSQPLPRARQHLCTGFPGLPTTGREHNPAHPPESDSWGRGQGEAGLAEGGTESSPQLRETGLAPPGLHETKGLCW